MLGLPYEIHQHDMASHWLISFLYFHIFIFDFLAIYEITCFRSTTDMQHGEDLEVTVRTSARELAVYCVFLTILVIGIRAIRFYNILSS